MTKFSYAVTVLFLGSFPSLAVAAERFPVLRSTGIFGFGWIGFLIAFLTRKYPFGGWLLYYYFSMFVTCVLWIWTLPALLNNLSPSLWDSSIQFIAYILLTILSTASLLGAAAVSTLLFVKKHRGIGMYSLLKKFLLASLIIVAVCLIMDLISWQEAIFPDVIGLVGSVVWYLYILHSDRVKHVLVLQDFHDWYEFRRSVSTMQRQANKGASLAVEIDTRKR